MIENQKVHDDMVGPSLFQRIVNLFGASVLLMASTATQALAQQAPPQIVVDPAGHGPHPVLDKTQNGLDQINIIQPNGAGVSHNMFRAYGVPQRGVILNNATHDTQTKIGGVVLGNTQLHGHAAGLILNEVTGPLPSQILGYTEVAGKQAAVVIANPNGLTCNGCGFINTSRVTLATGHPELNSQGGLQAFTIAGGTVHFGAQGADFATVPVLDILSRRVKIDGQVNAQRANLVLGRNHVAYGSNAVTPLADDGRKKPELAVDTAALGGLYANSIYMIVNEAGAGVRVDGTMAANAGDMHLDGRGNLVLNGTMAASGNVVAHQTGPIQLGAQGHVYAGEQAEIHSQDGLENAGHIATQNGTLSLHTEGLLNNKGIIYSQNGAAHLHGHDITNSGQIITGQDALHLEAEQLTNKGGLIYGNGGVEAVIGRQIDNRQGVIQANAGDLHLATAQLLNDGGGLVELSPTHGLVIDRGGNGTPSASARDSLTDFQNGQGLVESAGDLRLAVTGLNGLDQLIAGRDLAITTPSLVGREVLQAGRNVDVSLPGAYSIAQGGGILAGGGIQLTAGSVSNDGALSAQGGALSVTSGGDLRNTGVMEGASGVRLTLPGTLTNSEGAILADNGSIALSGPNGRAMAGLYNQSGQITASGATSDLVILADRLSNTILKGTQVAQSSHTFWGQGRGSGDADIAVPQGLLNAQGEQGTGYVRLLVSHKHPRGRRGAAHAYEEETHTSANSAEPLLSAGQDLLITSAGGILNDGGHLAAGRDVALSGGALNNIGYQNERRFFLSCDDHAGCGWDSSHADPAFTGSTPGGKKGYRPPAQQWGPTVQLPGVQGSITAGRTIAGDFTGAINNNTKIAHATAPLSGHSAVSLPGLQSDKLTPVRPADAAKAHNLTSLPGFNSGDRPNQTLPSAGISGVLDSLSAGHTLFVPNRSPSVHYLLETNPRYASFAGLHSSDYLLGHLGHSMGDYRFLGDGGFDARYIQQQIVSATGQVFLGGTYQTADQQMHSLLDNAANQAKALGLTFGVALTPEQQEKLTHSIVWYVPVNVDGQMVLAPKLYLAPGEEQLASGGVIAAKTIALSANEVTNSGLITAQDGLGITAIAGDLANLGGSISGNDVALAALHGNLRNESVLNRQRIVGGMQDELVQQSSILARGKAQLQAGQDIIFKAGNLNADGDISLVAGRDVTLGSLTTRGAGGVRRHHFTQTGSFVKNYGSSVMGNGAVEVAALGGDLTLAGSGVMAGKDALLQAKGNLALNAVTDEQHSYSQSVSHSLFRKKTIVQSSDSTNEVGSLVVANDNAVLKSGADMAIKGMVSGSQNAALTAGGALSIDALKDTAASYYQKKKSGFSFHISSGKTSIGYGKSRTIQTAGGTSWAASSVSAGSGDLVLQAKSRAAITGSMINAGHDVSIDASSVAFKAVEQTLKQTQGQRSFSIGVSAGLSSDSVVGQIVQAALAAGKAKGKGSAMVAGMEGAQAAYTAVKGLAEGMALIGVQADIGFKKTKSDSKQDQSNVIGSMAYAGNQLSVVASGNQPGYAGDGVISAIAAKLEAKDISLDAQKDIDLEAGWNRSHSEMRRSETGASVGVKYDIGGAQSGLSVEASAQHQSQRQESNQATAVDTTLHASNSVTLKAHDSTILRGAEVRGRRVDVKTGQLTITSLQNTSDFKSVTTAISGGVSIPIPGMGAGMASGNASYQHQKLVDQYASTGQFLSGIYAGDEGVGVDVAGNTSLTAGVITSTADKAKNHITTGSLTSRNLENISRWKLESEGFQVGLGGAGQGNTTSWLGQVGQAMAANSMSMLGGGRDYNKSSISRSAISDNITINTTRLSGDLSRDTAHANGAFANKFNAQKLQNQMQAQSLGTQLVGEVVGSAFEAIDDARAPARRENGDKSAQQKSSSSTGLFSEDGVFSGENIARSLIEAGGTAGVAALTGGNVGAVGLGTLTGKAFAMGIRPLAEAAASGLAGGNRTLHDSLAHLIESAAASAGGAVGGLVAGGGSASVNALNGAAAASAIEQYNDQAHEKKREEEEKRREEQERGVEAHGVENIHVTAPRRHKLMSEDEYHVASAVLGGIGLLPIPGLGEATAVLAVGLDVVTGHYSNILPDALGVVPGLHDVKSAKKAVEFGVIFGEKVASKVERFLGLGREEPALEYAGQTLSETRGVGKEGNNENAVYSIRQDRESNAEAGGIRGARGGGSERETDRVHNIEELMRRPGFGETLKKNSTKTGKQYKGANVYKANKNIKDESGVTILNKGDHFYLDSLHHDHLEVFSKKGDLENVLNLDGSVNGDKFQKAFQDNRKLRK